jgi:hypothetical protein
VVQVVHSLGLREQVVQQLAQLAVLIQAAQVVQSLFSLEQAELQIPEQATWSEVMVVH